MQGSVERKVTAATGGAGVGAAVGALAVWAVDAYVHTPGTEGDLPGPVGTAVMVLVAAGVAFVSGYVAKHTRRPDLAEEAATDAA
jgi:hypothetical protein